MPSYSLRFPGERAGPRPSPQVTGAAVADAYPGQGGWAPPQPETADADRKALGNLWTGSILFLVASVGSYLVDLVLNPFSSLSVITSPTDSTVRTISFGTDFYVLTSALLVFGLGMELVALFFVRGSFRTLATVDHPRFRMPAILTLVLMAAFVLLLAGTLAVVSALPAVLNAISQLPPGSTAAPDIPGSAFLAIAAGGLVDALAAVMVLIGGLGGIVFGLWRVGGRYSEDLIRAGAILAIIPLVNFIAPILVIVGVRRARSKISGPAATP
jgi:hypothetical protein